MVLIVGRPLLLALEGELLPEAEPAGSLWLGTWESEWRYGICTQAGRGAMQKAALEKKKLLFF